MYEYEVVSLKLTDEQKQIIQMGIGNVEQLNGIIQDTINAKSKEGWEPLYPFSVPQLWFRREVKKSRTKQ